MGTLDLSILAIVLIVAGVLEIIIFFKIWGMADDIRMLKRFSVGFEASFMRYMLLGEKEKANHLVKEQMVDFLSKSMENIGYYSSDKKSFVESSRVSKFMEEKLGQAKQTGIELPEHLKTAEAFWEYYKEMAKV